MPVTILLLLLSAAPQVMPQDPSRAGWEAIQRGDGEKAAAAFRAVLADYPNDVRALAGAGMAAHLTGRADQAISYLKKATQIDPEFVQAYYMLGQIAYSQGDIDLAIKSYERVVKVAPGNQEVYQQLEAWKKEAALHDTFNARPTARFTVLFEGPEQQTVAARVSTALESAYARVGQTLNTYPSETVTAILYTREQFRDITKSPSWAAAAYDGRIRIPVMGALKSPGELDRIVTHEYVHALVQQMYPRVPGWLNEGLATLMEGGDRTWLTSRLRAAGELIPLASLDSAFRTSNGEEAALAYAQSYVGTRILSQRLGANFPVFLQYVSNGTPFDQALLVFNVSAADVEKEWKRQAHGTAGR